MWRSYVAWDSLVPVKLIDGGVLAVTVQLRAKVLDCEALRITVLVYRNVGLVQKVILILRIVQKRVHVWAAQKGRK